MKKAELLEKVAEVAGTTKDETEKVVNTLFDVIGDTLQKGEKVQFVGFGSFETKIRAGRHVKNPRTGEDMILNDCRVPKFTAGKTLKDKVR